MEIINRVYDLITNGTLNNNELIKQTYTCHDTHVAFSPVPTHNNKL